MKEENLNKARVETDTFIKESLKDLTPEQKKYAADVLSNAITLASCLVVTNEKSIKK